MNKLLVVAIAMSSWAGAARADCLAPPAFEPWCSTGATTGVHAQRVVNDDGTTQLIARLIVGTPIEGLVVDEPLPLDCLRGGTPPCAFATDVALLMTSSSTFELAQPIFNGFQVQFPSSADPISVQDALRVATQAGPQGVPDVGLCIEALYALSDTDRDQGLPTSNECRDSDGPFGCATVDVGGVSLLAVTGLLLRRRRRRHD